MASTSHVELPGGIASASARLLRTLTVTQVIGSTGFFSGTAVSALLAKDLLGSKTWIGVAPMSGVLGAAVSSTLLSRIMQQRGRRFGLVLGYGVAAGGASIVAVAARERSFSALVVGMFLFGCALACNQLSRYAASDCVAPAARGRAIGRVVWFATVGAVVGPNLVGASGRWAKALGLPRLAGPYLVGVVAFLAAAAYLTARLRPDPLQVARAIETSAGKAPGEDTQPFDDKPAGAIAPFRIHGAQVDLVAMAFSQAVMIMIMVMTPVHMRDHHHSLAAVGVVLSGHFFGMYAFSPLTGRMVDRLGQVRVIRAGVVLLAAAMLASLADPDSKATLMSALLLLGIGWNFSFIAGSALLTDAVPQDQQTRAQGFADTVVGIVSASGSLGAGFVFGSWGYTTLAVVGCVGMSAPLVFAWVRRSSVSSNSAR